MNTRTQPYQFKNPSVAVLLFLLGTFSFSTWWTCTIWNKSSTMRHNNHESLLNINRVRKPTQWSYSLTGRHAARIHWAKRQVLLEIGNISVDQNNCTCLYMQIRVKRLNKENHSQKRKGKKGGKREDKMKSFRKCVHSPHVCYYFSNKNANLKQEMLLE